MSNLKEKAIPYGYCHCGCGQKTKLAKQTDKKRGMIKGVPNKFIHGHHVRGKKSNWWNGGTTFSSRGHILIKAPKNHPYIDNRGYVRRSHLVIEKILGKYLPKKSVVHHIDGDPTNDSPKNLVLCENQTYHLLLHQRQRVLKICGHANWRKCCICKKYSDPENMIYQKRKGRKNSFYFYHKECFNKR